MILKEIIYDPNNPNNVLDLINYNFDQLVVNGYGDIGYTGPIGLSGFNGQQGLHGNTGLTGSTGSVGPDGISLSDRWSYNTENWSGINSYISPIHNTPFASIYIGNNPNGKGRESVLTLDRNTQIFSSNLRLSNGSTYILDFKMSINTLELVASDTAADIWLTFKFDNIIFGDSSSDLEFMSLSSDGIGNSTVSFNNNVNIDGVIKINGPSIQINGGGFNDGQILTIGEGNKMKWMPDSFLGSNVTIGTIIAISPGMITSTYFETTESSVADNISIVGRGKGVYSGWYLCNGYTWSEFTANPIIHNVPNMHGKTFNDGSSDIEHIDDTITVGSSIVTNTVIEPKGSSLITDISVDLDPIDVGAVAGGLNNPLYHERFSTVELVYIIYLKHTNLKWQFVDISSYTLHNVLFQNTPANPVISTITSFDSNETRQVYHASSNFTMNNNSDKIYIDYGVIADVGWYLVDNSGGDMLGYWDGNTWSNVIT